MRESGTILDSGFHAGESGFQVLDSEILVSGTWIPNSNKKWDLDSLRFWISKRRSPDSTRKNFRIADSLSWGESKEIANQFETKSISHFIHQDTGYSCKSCGYLAIIDTPIIRKAP